MISDVATSNSRKTYLRDLWLSESDGLRETCFGKSVERERVNDLYDDSCVDFAVDFRDINDFYGDVAVDFHDDNYDHYPDVGYS